MHIFLISSGLVVFNSDHGVTNLLISIASSIIVEAAKLGTSWNKYCIMHAPHLLLCRSRPIHSAVALSSPNQLS